MKQFFKMLLAVVCGIILANILVIFIFAGIVGAAAGSTTGKGTTVLPRSGVLAIDLSEIIITEQDQPEDPLAMLQGQMQIPVGLWKAVRAINIAAADPGVKYIYLKADGSTTGISTLGELRKALENFRLSGKPVIAWTENPGAGVFYISSVADKIYMSEYQGANGGLVGIASQSFYLKDLLDKAGVNMQLIRHGKYKSAGEMFVRNSPSEENKEQNERMVASLWETVGGTIAEGRNIPLEKLDRMVENIELCLPEDYLAAGLVDGVFSRDSLKRRLASLAVVDDFRDLQFIPFADYANAKVVPNFRSRNKIAVLYADGEIVDGNDLQNVAGDRFANEIDKIRADKGIKAVVLRVNSPGGSVLASEKIKSEIELLRKDKPVVASYGNYAASGGYWISNSCDKIFSDATTLTGSIGVFSMIPDLSKTIRDIAHVNMVTVSSNKHADMYGLTSPLSPEETAYMQASVENIYSRFVSTVSEGRDLEPDFVDSIAQGRVWAGSDALKIGLVDEIGTLEDAVKWAAAAGGNPDLAGWNVAEYPKPKTEMEMLMSMFGQKTPDENIFSGTPFGDAAGQLLDWYARIKKNPADVMFARIPYLIDIR